MHTKGPWHVGTKEAHYCIYDEHGWWIADASPLGSYADAKANARLIAAAPELLEALRFMVDAANTEPGMAIYKAHIEQATEAIRKASR